jgi:GTP-binding protein Era
MRDGGSQTTAPTTFTSGFVTLVGRPNSGKSTLINAVIGRKVAITSSTPQTTRHRFRAVLDTPDCQLVLVDTPGIHKPIDALGEELNHSAIKALEAVDAVALLLDATKPFGTGDEWVCKLIANSRSKKILVISKAALATDENVRQQIEAATAHTRFDEVVITSALEGRGLESFVTAVRRHLPEGPRWFPEGTSTDQPLEVIIAEFIREKILRSTFDEVPHAVGVQVEELEFEAKKNLYRIYAIIYVERDSQKGIIIGRSGAMIKQIGTQARAELAHFLAADIFLDLRVKVRKNWRRDANQIRRFGYGE